MRLRRLEIKNFRGVKSLAWRNIAETAALVGLKFRDRGAFLGKVIAEHWSANRDKSARDASPRNEALGESLPSCVAHAATLKSPWTNKDQRTKPRPRRGRNIIENADPASTIESLRAGLGRAPAAEDVLERHLLMTAQKHAADWQWGLFRNARFNLAESRSRLNRREDALRLHLGVCPVDLNGPTNCGTKDPAITERFPPFDPTTAFLAPGVVSRAATVAHELGLSPGDLRHQFEAVADSVRSLNLPRPTAEAWNELASALSSRGT